MHIAVSITMEPFDVTRETDCLRQSDRTIGAVVTFVGQVRDFNEGSRVDKLFLEHYPGMAEAELTRIIEDAGCRWPVKAARVIHRIGELSSGDAIVYVAVGTEHRGDAFRACEFIMDYLKTRAPFWKKESMAGSDDGRWLAARASDLERQQGWK